MNRQDLRNRYPFHSNPMPSQGYTPETPPPTFWGVLAGIVCWGAIILAMFGIAFPLLRWVILWVLAHD